MNESPDQAPQGTAPVKRKPLYFFPLLIAASYTAVLMLVGSLSVNPNIAQFHPDSARHQFGAFFDRIHPIVSLPIRPLGLLGTLGIPDPPFCGPPVVFLYIFLLSCIAALFIRSIRHQATNVA